MENVGQVEVERRGGLLGRWRPRESQAEGGLDALTRAIKAYNPKADLKEVHRAFLFAEVSHRGQKRASPVITPPQPPHLGTARLPKPNQP